MANPNRELKFWSVSRSEIIVSLFCIFILISFSVPRVARIENHIQPDKTSLRRMNERKINKRIQQFFAETGHYPTSLQDLVTCVHPYLEKVPIDPITGKADWLVTNRYFYSKKDLPQRNKYFPYIEFKEKIDLDPAKGGHTPRGPQGIYRVMSRTDY